MLVTAKSAPDVLVVGIETMSLAVVGVRVVPVLDQKPTVPPPLMVPVQVKLPVELAKVQPVAPEPPATLTSIAPSACRFKAVVVAPKVPVPAKVMAVAEVAMVSIEATPVKAPPVVTFKPPFEVKAKVPVALPMAVLLVPAVLILTLPEEPIWRYLIVPALLVTLKISTEPAAA